MKKHLIEKITNIRNNISIRKNIIIYKKDDKCGFINTDNVFIQEPIYKSLKFNSDERYKGPIDTLVYSIHNHGYGLLDATNGSILTQRPDASILSYTKDNIIIAKKKSNYGLMNNKGVMVVDYMYDDILVNYESSLYLTVIKNKKRGVIDRDFTTIIEPKYNSLEFITNSKAIYKLGDSYGMITINGFGDIEETIENKYGKIVKISTDNYNSFFTKDYLSLPKYVATVLNHKYGLMDLYGNIILENEYDSLELLSDIKHLIMFKKDGKFGVIYLPTKEVIVENIYDKILYNSSGSTLLLYNGDDMDLMVIK